MASALRAYRATLSEGRSGSAADSVGTHAANPLFLQQWFNLSDPAVEETLYDMTSMRAFVQIDMGEAPVPDETTVCKFRHLLEEHKLGPAILKEIDQYESQGQNQHRHNRRCNDYPCTKLDKERFRKARS